MTQDLWITRKAGEKDLSALWNSRVKIAVLSVHLSSY